jgi:diadenosine tetraphosphate (Ap4A) HIT family hydrolase
MPIDATLPYDDQNIFAMILRGEIPNRTVYEDEWVLAFHDIAPQAPIHILVIPKGAYVSLDDFTATASDAEIAGFYRAVGQIARDQGLVAPGNRTIANTGPDGGQIIPHFHVHLCGGRNLGRMIPE